MDTAQARQGECAAYRAGSARIALEVSPAFTRYIFVEKSIDRCADLETLKAEFPEKADRIQIVHQDCNAYLMDLCGNYVWKRNRAVLFLDPFGMQVEWTTVKAIASTHAIDLWYLFPIGVGVNRLLRRDGGISEALSRRLDSVFGTHSWDSAFYRKHLEAGLFGSEESVHKDAAFDRIKEFLLDRMRRVFVRVAENPLVLRNSKNSPLFLLCFACGNERGATTAVKIAQDILKE